MYVRGAKYMYVVFQSCRAGAGVRCLFRPNDSLESCEGLDWVLLSFDCWGITS